MGGWRGRGGGPGRSRRAGRGGWPIRPGGPTLGRWGWRSSRPTRTSNLPTGDRFEGMPLYVQSSGGVPLGGGVLGAVADVLRGSDDDSTVAQLLGPALRFGWRVAGNYADAAARWDVADVIMVAEVMALAFVQ